MPRNSSDIAQAKPAKRLYAKRLDEAWALLEDSDVWSALMKFHQVFRASQSVEAFAGVLSCHSKSRDPLRLLDWGLANMDRVVPASTPEDRRLGAQIQDLIHRARRWAEQNGYRLKDPRKTAEILARWPQKLQGPAEGAEARPSKRGAAAAPAAPAPTAEAPAPPLLDLPAVVPEVLVRFEPPALLDRLRHGEPPQSHAEAERLGLERLEDWRLSLRAQHLSLTASFDDLLSLESVQGVETLRYQVETARRVLRVHRGRALLADEVGLGKTIEACLVLKEYLLRGLVERFLILCPPSLVGQWQSELREKFLIRTVTTSDEAYRADPAAFWRENKAVVASLHTAKIERHAEVLRDLEFDLVVVDEAHHLKNRATVAWKFVNALRRKFLLLVTATPVQNDLGELYNLITLLRPGTLGTPAQFRERFVASGKKNVPRDPEELRRLMTSVMVRNTRSVADLKLPPRRAVTYHVTQAPAAEELYRRLTELLRERYAAAQPKEKLVLHSLLMRAGSSLIALANSLERFAEGESLTPRQAQHARELHKQARSLAGHEAKLQRLGYLLEEGPGKKIVFTQYRDTLDFLERSLHATPHRAAVFHGGLSVEERSRAVAAFRQEADVLLCTEAGSEGQNLQFARTVVNYDLPWNPMRIEQRIGRVHRIGQTEPVYVFNLALAGSIESAILRVLEQKINLFELVVGELGVILGNLTEDQDFPDRVVEIWLGSKSEQEAEQRFDELGQEITAAREQYEESAKLDAALFGRDFET
jgi:SNF2 family DNA or RNA helicase